MTDASAGSDPILVSKAGIFFIVAFFFFFFAFVSVFEILLLKYYFS